MTDTTPAGPARLEIAETEWHRIAPKYLIAEMIGLAVVGVLFLVATVPLWIFVPSIAPWPSAAVLLIFGLIAAFTPRRVRAIGYALRADDLLLRRGILFQRFVAVPYGRMQLIDITRGPLLRLLGLSDLKLVTAAASTGVLIPGLAAGDAEALRDRLVELAESRRAGL